MRTSAWYRRVRQLVPILAGLHFAACGPPKFKQREVANGQLFHQNGVWILELHGSPGERGQAAGELVGEQIRWALPRYLRDTLLLVNLAPEAWAGLACSCLAATTTKSATGSPLLARNLDWYGGDVLRELGLLTVVKGDENDFVALSYPGLVGVVTGMNQHFLSAANLVVLGQKATPAAGVPVTFALRRLLETQSTLEGSVSYLHSIQRTVPQNYAIADRTTAVVLETWRQRFRRRDPKDGFIAVGNLFDEDKRTHPQGRYPKMMKVGEKPSVGVAELKAALVEVAMGDMNVHSAIFDPGAGVIHGSSLSRPAAKGPYWEVDVGALLGESKRSVK